ncbi:mitotic fidelity of chromosome transmission- protein [Coemansia aciculifera]|uniref:Mitotic fidelity of chromosome transmission-protein n=1 Tax=Coemansia aciculifera TaxID=417176 RepID=A0ACC1M585_9FUNG|nr:mitotic fidelity of chromosome transmission- protein [Coemansia aciculifera]
MSNRTARRPKSPAVRNKFTDIGVTGRKTGVRVAGNVRVDEDGLENVDEFYQKTSPAQNRGEGQARGKPAMQTLQNIVSPTPIRSTSNYGTLMGALDIPVENPQAAVNKALQEIEDEMISSPIRARATRIQFDSADMELDTPTKSMAKAGSKTGNRRATMAPARLGAAEPDWVRSPKKNRRVTMALTAQEPLNGHSALDTQYTAAADGETTAVADSANGAELVSDAVPYTHDSDEGTVDGEDGHVPDAEPGYVAEDDGPTNVVDDAEYGDEHTDGPANDEEPLEDLRIGEDDIIPDSQDEDNESAAEEEEVEAPVPVKSPAKRASKAPAKKKSAKGVSSAVAAAEQDDEVPIRRSSRASVQPLAYWRNEHIEYEYESGPVKGVAVPKMTNIVRVRQTAEEKNNAKKRRVKRSASAMPSLRGIKSSEIDLDDRGRFYYYDDEHFGFPVENDATGKFGPKSSSKDKDKAKGANKRALEMFDDDDDIPVDERPRLVVGLDAQSEMPLEVAISRQSIEWANIDTKGEKYKMGNGLFIETEDGDVISSTGVLCLAVGGKKPARNSMKRNIFYLVTSGKVEVELHGSKFKVGALGQFLVPAFNSYSITNVGTHPAQLYCVNVGVPPTTEEAE